METEGDTEKLDKCNEDCVIKPIVIIRKEASSIKLALDSNILNNQTFKDK